MYYFTIRYNIQKNNHKKDNLIDIIYNKIRWNNDNKQIVCVKNLKICKYNLQHRLSNFSFRLF